MHHSDINPDLLPSFLNVIKSFFHYFSLIIPHSSLLVLSYNSKSPHSAVQKLQHVPQARLCHLHSGLQSQFYYALPHKAALRDDDTLDTYLKSLVHMMEPGRWQVVICRPCLCLWAVRAFEPQGHSCCGGTITLHRQTTK